MRRRAAPPTAACGRASDEWRAGRRTAPLPRVARGASAGARLADTGRGHGSACAQHAGLAARRRGCQSDPMIALALLLQAASPAAAPNQLPAPVSAQTPAGPPAQPPATMLVEPVAMLIATFDADGDARVGRAELAAGARRSFAAIDTAGSGAIGYIAFADWAERFLGDRHALPSPFEVDRDGDDRISAAELEAALGATFARLDRDRDGMLTRAELLTIRATAPNRLRPERERDRNRDAERQSGGQDGGQDGARR